MRFIKLLYRKFFDDDIPALAAQLTYYLILSFFPFLIFLLALLSYTSFTGNEILNDFSLLLPQTTYNLLKEIINRTSGTKNETLLSFGMLATIWAASNGVSAVIRGINKAYNQKENRPFWKVKWISIIFTLALAIVLIFSLVMLVMGEMLWKYLFIFFGLPGVFRIAWNIIRHLIPLFTIFMVFIAVYRYIPSRHMTFREVIPGAVFSTTGSIIISLIFSYYVNSFGLYTNTYGSIGSVIALLIWLYWNSIIIILGSEINAALDSAKRTEKNSNIA
ncbi:MAG: YihY/virulence factor BrkB family protein [Firmicutes bacterium]|nr:YihY/virulence factor BrkB family protein [Bacillota bacterium]